MIRPLTMEAADYLGEVVRKSDGKRFEVAMGTEEHAYLYAPDERTPPVTWDELLADYTMADGSPCGVEET